MSQCVLRLQMLCYEGAPNVLQLLRIGGHELGRFKVANVSIFATNRFLRSRSTNIDRVEQQLVGRSFNFATIAGQNRSEVQFLMQLSLSPNDRYWADNRMAGGA